MDMYYTMEHGITLPEMQFIDVLKARKVAYSSLGCREAIG